MDKMNFGETAALSIPIPALFGESNGDHPRTATALSPDIGIWRFLICSHVCSLSLASKIFL